MPALAYVNGRYGPLEQAAIAVEDRGFQFADSVYEVVAFLNGRLLDWERHLWRLRRSLAALFIDGLMADAALEQVARRLLRASRYADGTLYIQVTRGLAPRGHAFPRAARPTLVMTVRRFDFHHRRAQLAQGVAAITLPDERRQRRDVKGTALLPTVLAKQEAVDAGADEAILLRDGEVTEGASTNVHLVDGAGAIITHPLSAAILAGIGRQAVLEEAAAAGIVVHERPILVAELADAAELFLTSTTAPLLPVVQLDGRPVGTGAPGPVSRQLGQRIWARIGRQTGWAGAAP